MNPEEKQQFNQMLERVNKLYDLYYRTNFIDKVIHNNPVYFNGKVFLKDGNTISTGATTGLKIGNAITEKIGFYNTIPVIQGGSIADPTGGITTDSEARTAINALITRLET